MSALTPDILIQLGPVPITNTLLNTFLVDTLVIGGALTLKK